MEKHVIAIVQSVCFWVWDCNWSSAGCWPQKLCWLLTTFESDAASAHRRLSLVSACQFQSVSPASAIYWCGFHAARSESEWCILLWCLAAQTAAARHLSSCWRLLLSRAPTCTRAQEYWAAATRALDFTPDIMALLTDQTSVL